ncbi:MAG TPA: hypothetical protein VD999_00175 [Vitreimonas sp.]|nr:hypothetical protein [Vitreimonas sp.]
MVKPLYTKLNKSQVLKLADLAFDLSKALLIASLLTPILVDSWQLLTALRAFLLGIGALIYGLKLLECNRIRKFL